MMINKSHWVSEAERVTLAMPISKVDKENRIVSGFATLDNEDTQDDIVLADASARAFQRFRGNIREMHQPVAVGRMVDFKEDSYYDSDTEKFYDGIYCSVYVSKGAQDTWEKVLDGTLQGFSIGGAINDAETMIVKSEDESVKTIRVIKDYDLVELSLVDSPANPLANVFSITKGAEGMVLKGMVTEVSSENVFWCESDGIAKTSSDEVASCGVCETDMKNIGWFEYDNKADKAEKARGVIDTHLSLIAKSEGGADMPNEKVEKAETVEETVEEVVETETDDVEEVEKAAEVSEVEEEEVDVKKVLDEFRASLTEEFQAQNQEVAKAIEAATAEFSQKTDELVTRYNELTQKFDALNTEVDTVQKKLDSFDGPAVKKSADLGDEDTKEISKSKKNAWSGIFLNSSDL